MFLGELGGYGFALIDVYDLSEFLRSENAEQKSF